MSFICAPSLETFTQQLDVYLAQGFPTRGISPNGNPIRVNLENQERRYDM